jgi:hypothetical protein
LAQTSPRSALSIYFYVRVKEFMSWCLGVRV